METSALGQRSKLAGGAFAALADSGSDGADDQGNESEESIDDAREQLPQIKRQLNPNRQKRNENAKRNERHNKKRAAAEAAAARERQAPIVVGRSITAMIASAVGASSLLHATPADFVRVKEAHFARLLYTNPVCLLTSSAANLRTASAAASASLPAAGALRNVMTVSWLAPTSNRGEFVMTLHAARYTARLVHAEGHRFVLSVPVRGMEALVKSIGACSGSGAVAAAAEAAEDESAGKAAASNEADGSASATAAVSAPAAAESSASAAAAPIVRADKIRQLAVPMCRPGCKSMQIAAHADDDDEEDDGVDAEARADDADDAAAELMAVRGCCAHLVCTVTRALPATDANPASVAHNVLFCRVQRAYVHGAYFQNTQFVAPRGAPPYLSFLGSGGFAHVIAAPPPVASARGSAD